jgi:ABC-2 type transport system ATP-binding protein
MTAVFAREGFTSRAPDAAPAGEALALALVARQAAPLALDVREVSHAFGARRALDGVSLSVAPGSFCALLGLNGAGKTTLFSLVTRLFDNNSGAIRVWGHDVRRSPGEALRRLGVVFQSRTLDMDLTVIQNLIYHASLHGLSRREGKQRGAEELERVGLADRAGEKIRNLSGGQMRRVEIARALLHRPRLLLLDEPTVGLDIGARQEIIAQVRRLVKDDGLGVLWATHLFDEVRQSDKLVMLHRGKVLAEGVVGAVVERAGAHDLEEAFRSLAQSGHHEGNGNGAVNGC